MQGRPTAVPVTGGETIHLCSTFPVKNKLSFELDESHSASARGRDIAHLRGPDPYISYTSTFAEPWQGRPGPNMNTLNVVLFLSLSSPSRHPVSGFVKQPIAQFFISFACFLNICSSCSVESMRLPHPPHPHGHTRLYGMAAVYTIWSVSKSGSALHATTSSDIAKGALPAGLSRFPMSACWESHW